MSSIRIPKYFVGLHAHALSLGDSIGLPKEHMEYVRENGMDAWALTDHGHMTGFSHQYLHQKELDKKGIKFKSIFGNEAYFIESLEDWKNLYTSEQERKHLEKIAKKEKDIKKKVDSLIGENIAPHIEDLENTEQLLKNDESTEGDTVVENEEETKFKKVFDPLKKRNHLVLLAKNNDGLKALFKCTSMSYINGFYKYPRMDFKLLKEYAKGNIIASSACITGDAKIQTNFGILTLVEVIDKIKNKEDIFVLSFSESENRLVFRKVLWGEKTRKNAILLKIKLKNGKEIKLTPDHKVLTSKGWMRADELNKNMPLEILTTET
jgi:DNA polymerase III alpha subunit